jgi:hypothetical protein
MARCLIGPCIVMLCGALLGCSAPAEKQNAQSPADRNVDTGFYQAGGALVRCSTNDGGFTTICRSP